MKIFTLTTFLSIWPFLSLTAENNGRIYRIQNGAYQLSYPGQSMRLFFNYFPKNGPTNMFVEIELSDNQQYEIVYIIKQFIDQLPAEFIDRFLNIDIFLMRIQDDIDFGYTIDNQVVVEISKIRNGNSFAGSIQSSLAHELAHLVEKGEDTKSGSAAMKNYLEGIRTSMYEENNRSVNIYDQGYVSRYASGELINGYNSSEEFAEMFTHLLCVESRVALFSYLEKENSSILDVKLDRYIKFLEYNLPSLGEEYLYKKAPPLDKSVQSYESLDGETLLESHEQKSNEAMSAGGMEEYEQSYLSRQDDDFAELEARIDQIEPEHEDESIVYRYSQESDTFSQSVPPNDTKKERQQKKKKKKGTSWLLIGTAVYIALQLMK